MKKEKERNKREIRNLSKWRLFATPASGSGLLSVWKMRKKRPSESRTLDASIVIQILEQDDRLSGMISKTLSSEILDNTGIGRPGLDVFWRVLKIRKEASCIGEKNNNWNFESCDSLDNSGIGRPGLDQDFLSVLKTQKNKWVTDLWCFNHDPNLGTSQRDLEQHWEAGSGSEFKKKNLNVRKLWSWISPTWVHLGSWTTPALGGRVWIIRT